MGRKPLFRNNPNVNTKVGSFAIVPNDGFNVANDGGIFVAIAPTENAFGEIKVLQVGNTKVFNVFFALDISFEALKALAEGEELDISYTIELRYTADGTDIELRSTTTLNVAVTGINDAPEVQSTDVTSSDDTIDEDAQALDFRFLAFLRHG